MHVLSNHKFSVGIDKYGILQNLSVLNDQTNMNWVISEEYLSEHGYSDRDKLFGNFDLIIDQKSFVTTNVLPKIQEEEQAISITYTNADIEVGFIYDLFENNSLQLRVYVKNLTATDKVINRFAVWASLAYIMFRDNNVQRNMSQSCAVFPHVSNHFTKLIAKKRDNKGPHLVLGNTKGQIKNIGTFCRYTNRFREQVSPSLDGSLFHQLIFVDNEFKNDDWIYDQIEVDNSLAANELKEWYIDFYSYETDHEYKKQLLNLNHPLVTYEPIVIKGYEFQAAIQLPTGLKVRNIKVFNHKGESRPVEMVEKSKSEWKVHYFADSVGEKRLEIDLSNGQKDFVVFNVMKPINELIEARVDYLIDHSFIDSREDPDAYGFRPISNQGESLGKLCFILKKNLVAELNVEQVNKVEQSAYHYVKNKWFINGDFSKPRYIHGSFYRIIDFDYVAHVYFLLSKFEESVLSFHTPETYLRWAAQIMILRFDKQQHENKREQMETEMNGIFNLFIADLLIDLRNKNIMELYEPLSRLWDRFCENIIANKENYAAAITEHHYDNAGFGPTAESLILFGDHATAKQYGELILANIGISNDFRNQNPDRWWEALSYMIHSLWGGLVSHSALVIFEQTGDERYLHAAYRSMMAVLYCYDWNATATARKLKKGEAASTYSIAYPNLNKPSLSHNRFGQSVFFDDDPELFAGNATGDDWDMGEELVAYLDGFGTTTYVYQKEGKLHCVNGCLLENNGSYIIKSFAAYPKRMKFYHMDLADIALTNEFSLNSVTIKRTGNKWETVHIDTAKKQLVN